MKVRSSVFRTAPIDAGVESAIAFSDFALRKGWTAAIRSRASVAPSLISYLTAFGSSAIFTLAFYRMAVVAIRFGERFFEEAFQWKLRPADQISIFEKIRTLDPAPHKAANAQVLAKLKQAIPSFSSATIAQEWAGLIDTMPDVIPVISPVPHVEGLIVATGFQGMDSGLAQVPVSLLQTWLRMKRRSLILRRFIYRVFQMVPKFALRTGVNS